MLRGLTVSILCLAPILAQDTVPPLEVWLGEGISQFESKHYPEAIASFQKVLEINPAAAHWYLAQIYLAQYVPGLRTAENTAVADHARNEFSQLLQLNGENGNIMASLGCLSYEEAQSLDDPQAKERKLDDARGWYQRWLSVDSEAVDANYAIGVVDSQKLYFALAAARARI